MKPKPKHAKVGVAITLMVLTLTTVSTPTKAGTICAQGTTAAGLLCVDTSNLDGGIDVVPLVNAPLSDILGYVQSYELCIPTEITAQRSSHSPFCESDDILVSLTTFTSQPWTVCDAFNDNTNWGCQLSNNPVPFTVVPAPDPAISSLGILCLRQGDLDLYLFADGSPDYHIPGLGYDLSAGAC